ncbi:hypothetical protein CHS0354_000321 [Potamilus streckersoni]|uniref:Uncharacterized protein n=1 Tax=Potamilus streckersoni TaxID=2493646 RepID=A0AAE0SI66_9BIVA|nr:hypothetical protein CHS0354_000321 [Potamilus streckersoni]
MAQAQVEDVLNNQGAESNKLGVYFKTEGDGVGFSGVKPGVKRVSTKKMEKKVQSHFYVMGFLLKAWHRGCEKGRKCPRCSIIGHAAKDCEIFVLRATCTGETYIEKAAQSNPHVNLNEKDLIKIQNAVDIRTGQQMVKLEIVQIRKEEGQTIPQTTTPKESLHESIQTCHKFLSSLKTHTPYYLNINNKMLKSNRFYSFDGGRRRF